MHKLDIQGDQLLFDGVVVSAKPTGRPRTIWLDELKDESKVLELAEDNDTRAKGANSYLTGNARRGLTPVVAIQFYRIE